LKNPPATAGGSDLIGVVFQESFLYNASNRENIRMGRPGATDATERVPAGRTLIKEGEEGRRFYIVARGKVSVSAKGSDGRVRSLATLEDGDFFGEITLLTNSTTTATVETLVPSTFLALRREQLDILTQRHPGLASQVRSALESRQAETCVVNA
jgi:ATP-binding cassette, subfamily B, bacterial